MVLVGEVSRIDAGELEHEADLEGEKPVGDLRDHVVAMGDSNTGFLGAVEWSCLVVAVNSSKLEGACTVVDLNQVS